MGIFDGLNSFIMQPALTEEQKRERLDQAAELLKDDPALRDAFERKYRQAADVLDDGEVTVKSTHKDDIVNGRGSEGYDRDELEKLKSRITDELISISDRKFDILTEKDRITAVKNEDIQKFPKEVRPQLAGTLVTIDCCANSSSTFIDMFDLYRTTDDERLKRNIYGCVRHGIDILDIDAPIYELLGRNVNSMEHWLYRIKDAADKDGFFLIPETKIVQVPLPILQLTRIDYMSLTQTTKDIVNAWTMKAFDLDTSKSYFIKTGVFSYKFDFRNQKVSGDAVKSLGEYLLFISNAAIMMESPLNGHGSLYGAATTRTWVVREFIEDKENNPTIYQGLPLHTEYRFFVDFRQKKILGVSPYWRKDIMEKRFAEDNDIHDRHDYITYKSHEDVMYRRYYDNIDKVTEHVQKLLERADFSGLPDQWSLDIMQNRNDFYIIDMALADNSSLNDCVKGELTNQNDLYIGITAE